MTKYVGTLALAALLFSAPCFAKDKARRQAPRRARPAAEHITNGPVVEGTGATWAVIAWTTNTGGSSVVRYGTAPGNLGQRAQSPYSRNRNHRVRLAGLRPHTRYFFEVVSGQGEGTGTQDARRGEFSTR